MNTIPDKDRSSLWIPNLIFENSLTGNHIDNHDLSSLSVKLEAEPKTKFNFKLHEHEEFAGDSNPLIFESSYELKLGCDFDLHAYPFDTQHCLIMVTF